MSSIKRLSGICHSIAHHAVSGLSYLHPHLSKACNEANIRRVRIQIDDNDSYPGALNPSKPLELAVKNLKIKIYDILSKEGFLKNDIIVIYLDFIILDGRDDYCIYCLVTIRHVSGKEFQAAVDYLGNKIKLSIFNAAR